MATPERGSQEKPPRKERIMTSISATSFLTDRHGNLLMVQDTPEWGSKWAPIAGLVDVQNQEAPEAAAVREAKEEMGLDIKLTDLIGVWSYYATDADNPDARPLESDDDKPKLHIGFAFCGAILGGTFTKQDDEVQNWAFFSPEQIDRMFAQNQIKVPQYNYKAIQMWRDKHHHPLTLVQSNGRPLVT